MKKLLLTTFLVGAAMTTASAKEYVVYNGGQELTADQTQLPVNFYEWNGTVNTVDNTDEYSKDFTVNNEYVAEKEVSFMTGGLYKSGNKFYGNVEKDGFTYNYILIAESDGSLTCKANITAPAGIEGVVRQIKIAENWITFSENTDAATANTYPYTANGTGSFTFGEWKGDLFFYISYAGGAARYDIPGYLYGLANEAPASAPSISVSADEITATTASLSYSVTIPSELSGATVAVYYKEATAESFTLLESSPLVLSDLTPNTSYTYQFKAVATLEGVEYVAEKEVSFMTGGLYKSGNKFYGNAEKDGFTYNYILIAESDGSLTCKANITAPEGTDGVVRQIKIADNWITFSENTDATADTYPYTANGTGSFTFGEWKGDLFFYIPYAGGAARYDIPGYLYGLANEAPASAPSISVSADEITATTASLSYSVTTPSELSGATVAVYYKEATAESFTLLESSPLVLSDLTPNTSYTYQFKAVATLEGVEYESKVKDVTFTTMRDGATAISWYAIADGKINNAYLAGEDPATMRRDIPVSIETKVTYNVDRTITVEATPHGDATKIVGMVPKITISSNDHKFEYKDMSVADGKWSITTDTTYPDNHSIGWLYFYIAYDGGASRIDVNGYTTGAENEAPSYGELGSINLELSNTELKVGDKAIVTAYGVDNNGHYLLGDDNAISLSLDGNSFNLEGVTITATDKGVGTLKATCRDASVEKVIRCFESTDCKTMTASESGFTYNASNYNANDTQVLAAAFDGNVGTEVKWDCDVTHEHGVVVEFEKNMVVEAIRLVWEGASAKKYTVTLYADFADADSQMLREVKAYETLVVEDGEGGGGLTIYKDFYKEDYTPYIAKKIVLATQQAWDAGWGIKLKEMAIDGTGEYSGTLTGVENVISDKATTGDIYNMQGICVKRAATTEDLNTLPAGIYIINGKKIVVK